MSKKKKAERDPFAIPKIERFKAPFPIGKCAKCQEKRKLAIRKPIKCCFKCNSIGGIFRDKRRIKIGEFDMSYPIIMGMAAGLMVHLLKDRPSKDESVEWPEELEVSEDGS